MIPILNEIKQISDLSVWKTKDRKTGTGFELLPCDLETESSDSYHSKLLGVIRSLNPNILARIKMTSSLDYSEISNCSRSKQISEIGFTKRSVFLFVEVSGEPNVIKRFRSNFSNDLDIQALQNVYEIISQSGLKTKPLCSTELKVFFPDPKSNWIKASNYITDGSHKIGIIRLNKPAKLCNP